MRKIVLVLSIAAAIMIGSAGGAMAAPGGVPRAHGLSGMEFGAAVSALAQSAPGAVADHVRAN